jgi:hypothetical protein
MIDAVWRRSRLIFFARHSAAVTNRQSAPVGATMFKSWLANCVGCCGQEVCSLSVALWIHVVVLALQWRCSGVVTGLGQDCLCFYLQVTSS